MSRAELVERFTLERVVSSPATFDYEKLDWLNGVHLRALEPSAYAAALLVWLRERGSDWDEATVAATAPLVQEKIERFDQYPDSFASCSRTSHRRGRRGSALHDRLAGLGTDRRGDRRALRSLVEGSEKPMTAFAPIRLAVTGLKVPPGLFRHRAARPRAQLAWLAAVAA